MRKTWLFSVLLILTLALAACTGAGQVDGTDTVGGLGTEVFETEGPVLGTEPVGGGVATEIPVDTEEPLATSTQMVEPTTVVGGVVGTPAGTAMSTGVPETGGPVNDDFLLCMVMDYNVQDATGEDLGDVNDFILDAAGSRIEYVVVGAGGFLGIGEQNLVVPFDQFTINLDEAEGNQQVLVFNGEAELLSNAPVVDLGVLDFTVDGWHDEFDAYWSGAPVSGTPVGTVEPVPQATGAAVETVVPEGTAAVPGAGEPMMTEDVDFLLASELCGAWVVDEETFGTAAGGAAGTMEAPGVGTMAVPTAGVVSTPAAVGTVTGGVVNETTVAGATTTGFDQIGEVGNVVIDPETGDVTFLVVDPDDAVIETDVWVPIPFQSARIVTNVDTTEPHDILVLVDASRLREAPSVEANGLPDVSVGGWDDDYTGYWGITR